MNGASARRASRRAISVFPTPVGPIIRMFLGVISSRKASGTRRRRQRLRSATATARLASACPTTNRSSSETISRGENSVMPPPPRFAWSPFPALRVRRGLAPPHSSPVQRSGTGEGDHAEHGGGGAPNRRPSQHFHHQLAVGVDADVGGDAHGAAGDVLLSARYPSTRWRPPARSSRPIRWPQRLRPPRAHPAP